jgi:hypothetical protein
LQTDSATALPRSLDGFEEIVWSLEQVIPHAPVFALELDGSLSVDNWTEHLRLVQSRYPLLSARINKIPGKRPFFEKTHAKDIPFRCVPLESHDSVEAAMARELAIGFGDGSDGLARVSLLHGRDRAILLFAAHHAAFDGRTMMMILEDLLDTISGKPLRAPFKTAPSLYRFFSLPEADGYRASLSDTSPLVPFEANGVYIDRLTLSEALSASVLSACKIRGVSMRALIAAVIAETGREIDEGWRSRPVKIASPIDLRSMLDQEDAAGLLVGITSAMVPAETRRDTIWETAASIGNALQLTANLDAQRALSVKFRQLIEDEHPPRQFVETWRKASPPSDIMINNYGRIAIHGDYGKFSIKMISSASLAGLGATQKVSMISVRGQIGLCIATCRPIPGILDKVPALLESACGMSSLLKA